MIVFMGCSSAQKQPAPASQQPTGLSPELVLSNLPPAVCVDIFLIAKSIHGPANDLFEANPVARKMYVSWYQAGFAYVKVTGRAIMRDQIYRNDQPLSVQAMYEGWYDGNSYGKLDRDLSQIKSAIDSTKNPSAAK